jgi:hypothetical protein
MEVDEYRGRLKVTASGSGNGTLTLRFGHPADRSGPLVSLNVRSPAVREGRLHVAP